MAAALLFTFYRNPTTCLQRVRCLRRLNPGVGVHGLFSGDSLAEFAPVLAEMDSCWQHPARSPEWLWSNYDLVIARWFLEHGNRLPFDYLWVHSWDLLLLDPLHRFVPNLQPDQLLLPGLRALQDMDERVLDPLQPAGSPRWSWLGEPGFQDFQRYWEAHYKAPLWCEVSPFGVLGRKVCEDYARACWDVPGHNEYRFPSLAAALGARLEQGNFASEFWSLYDPDRKPFNLDQVLELARQPAGRRLCHPFYYPISPEQLEC